MSRLSLMVPDEPDFLVDDDPQPSEYRGFTISFEYPPVPTREWDWAAYRTNDPEGGFRAYGRTYDECKREIDAQLAAALDAAAPAMLAALELIASYAGKTLISVEHGQPYSIGANAAFEDMASIAASAIAKART